MHAPQRKEDLDSRILQSHFEELSQEALSKIEQGEVYEQELFKKGRYDIHFYAQKVILPHQGRQYQLHSSRLEFNIPPATVGRAWLVDFPITFLRHLGLEYTTLDALNKGIKILDRSQKPYTGVLELLAEKEKETYAIGLQLHEDVFSNDDQIDILDAAAQQQLSIRTHPQSGDELISPRSFAFIAENKNVCMSLADFLEQQNNSPVVYLT